MDLYDRVTTTLQRGIAPNLRLLSTYKELAADLGSLDTELKRIAVREERQKRFRERQAPTATIGPGYSTTAIAKPVTATASPTIRARSETPCTEPRRPAPADATVICFNCDKPGHYATTCPEPRKVDLKEMEEDLYEQEGEDESGKEEP